MPIASQGFLGGLVILLNKNAFQVVESNSTKGDYESDVRQKNKDNVAHNKFLWDGRGTRSKT